MKIKIIKLFYLIMPLILQSSPCSVTVGGTGLDTLIAAGGLVYGTSSISTAVLSIGSSSRVLTVADSGLPVWQNFFPGYAAGINFAYGGTTSTLANSPTNTIILSTATPASILSTATDNTAVGYNTLTALTSGTNSVAIGSGALQRMNSGINNVAFGYQALNNNSTAFQSTGVGYQAGFNLTTGTTANTAVGHQALFNNRTGIENSACGVGALYTLNGGVRNVGFGYNAGRLTVTNDSIAFGYQALGANSGNQNIAIGANALSNITNANNFSFGSSALFRNTSGSSNIAVGSQAMYTNLSGGTNTAVGYLALYSNSSTNQSTAVGHLTLQNSVTANNTAFGYNALNAANGAATENTTLGSGAGSSLTTGSNNLYIGYNVAPISATESNNIVIGNSSALTAYMFGIHGVTSAGAIDVVINASGQLGTVVSSKKYKTNISENSDQIAQKILNFQVVTYTLIGDETKEIHYGLIAEDVCEIMPELVVCDKNNQVETVQYFKLIPLLVQVAQSKNNEINILKKSMLDLKKEINDLIALYYELKKS